METEAFIQEPPAAASPRAISWYRTPIDPKEFKKLHEKSDLRGWMQSFGHLGLLALIASAVFYSAGHWPWWVTVALLFFYGTCNLSSGIHELCHNTVFKTKSLNTFFLYVFGFLHWSSFEIYQVSHTRHHRYTLHVPEDMEVVLPMRLMAVEFFKTGLIDPKKAWWTLTETVRIACGRFHGKWELILFPEGSPDRHAPVVWARILLVGHGAVLFLSGWLHLWLLPVLVTFGPFYGGWLFFLCNNTQHIGLQDDVPDFRLCCRTFTVHPFVQFLDWHMNFHIEHHMYAAVPCYNLGRLHELIKHDLAPCPHGLIATWKEIAAIQKIQDANPDYQHVAPVPSASGA